MRHWCRIFVVFASVAVVAVAACGTPESKGAAAAQARLSVHDAWARPADSGGSTTVYFMLDNAAAVSDTLQSVRSDVAGETGLHVSMQNGRTMHMAPVRTLPVPANDSVAFRPLGAHVMLSNLRQALVVGDTVTLLLEFVSGQSLEFRADVRRP